MPQSWELIARGSAHDFVESLCAETMRHSAVQHEYLRRFGAGDFPDMSAAVRDYCYQYFFYSAEFTSYLESVIGSLRLASHREVLMNNLLEERGISHDVGGEEVPHTRLFQRLRLAAGVTPDFEQSVSPCTTALVWRDLFLQKCQSRQEGVGLGAIGIATEMIVSSIYPHILRGVKNHSNIAPEDYLFLSLHLECDDEHAEDLKRITVELAESMELREAIRFGVISSLNLRSAFWDVMLARATYLST